MAERRVYLKFIAETQQWRRAMARVQRDLANLRRRLDALSGAARTGAVAIGAAFGAALRVFVPFERAISRAGAAMRANAADMTLLRDAAKKIGRDTELTARQAANALENFARAGLGTRDALNLLRPAADLAVIGNIDMADAANKVTRALKVFNIDTARGPEVIDQMVVAMEQSTATMSDLSYVTELAGGSMSAFGQDISTTLALGGAIFDQLGERGAFALNALARALNDNKDRLREFGVEVFNADGSVRDMVDIVADFAERTRGMTAEQKLAAIGIIGNERAMRGLQAVLATNVDTLRDNAAAVRDSDGATKRWTDRLSADTMGKLKNLVSVIEDVAIRVGEHLKPQIDRAIESVANFIRNLRAEQIVAWTRRLAAFGELLVRLWVGAKVAGAVLGMARAVQTLKLAFAAGTPIARAFWVAATGGIMLLVQFLPQVIAYASKLIDKLRSGGGTEGIERKTKYRADRAEVRQHHGDRWTDDHEKAFRNRWQADNPEWRDYTESDDTIDARVAASRAGTAALGKKKQTGGGAAAPTTADDDAAAERARLRREQDLREIDARHAANRPDQRDTGRRAGDDAADPSRQRGEFESAEEFIAHQQARAAARAAIDAAELERYREHLAARLQTEQEFRDAERDLDVAQHEAELETDATRRADELERIAEQREALRDARAAQDEEDALLRDEALAWAREHELELNEEELEALQEFLARRREVEQAALDQELTDKFNAAATEKKWREMTDKEKLNWLNKIAASELAILDKGGKAQAAIKKAQKLRELGMSLATDPQEAYATTSKMFGWPLGPALGAAHAALTAAAILKGIKDVSGMRTGGWVGGAGGADSQLRRLSPDEFVAPRQTAREVIDARASQIAAERAGDDDDRADDHDAPTEINLNVDGEQLVQAVVPHLVRRRAGGF